MLEDNVGITQMPEEWIENIPLPDIYRHFDEYGVEYFKDLNVWHIPQLREKLNG